MEISIASGCSFLSSGYNRLQGTAIDENLLLKGESLPFFYITLNIYGLAVTISLGIRKIFWSTSLVIYELCHLLGNLPGLPISWWGTEIWKIQNTYLTS